jgi:hypothetical protein
MRNTTSILVILICSFFVNSLDESELALKDDWSEQTLKRLTLEEKVGQILQVRYFADYQNFDSAEYRFVRDEIRKYHIGSVVFGMHFN